MAIFSERADAPLRPFRDAATDAEGRLLLNEAGDVVWAGGLQALRGWVRRALDPQCERYMLPAYSAQYGNEFPTLFGQSAAEAAARLPALIRETLLVNPYITAVDGFSVTREGGRVSAVFRVHSVCGDFIDESEARIS